MKVEFETLTYEIIDQTGLISFTEPETRNALSLQMREELASLVPEIRDNRDLRALVVTGKGGSFCAGGDLKGLKDTSMQVDRARDRVMRLHKWFIEFCNMELPVIAAVDGPAYGAGFNLTLGCDFVLASERARFCAVFGRIGLVPDLGGLFLLPRAVGLPRAKELVMTARSFGAEEAKELGLVLEIHPHEALLERAMEFAGRFRLSSRLAAGQAKMLLNQAFHLDQKTMADMEAWAQAVCMNTDYHQDAISRFLNKAPLEFDWDRMVRDAGLE